MTDYTELVKALRMCAETENVIDECDLADCMMLKNGFEERPYNCIDHIMMQAADAVEELQTLTDAEEQGRLVPVVRCKDCKHAKKYSVVGGSIPYLFCREWCHSVLTDGFCHYGESKDGDEK